MCGLSFVVVLLLLAAVVRIRTSSAAAVVRLLGGDTECPLQVCQLSRSSESTHFRSFVEMYLYSFPPEPRIASEIGGTCLRFIS